jgi:hypothetical protein
MDLSQQPAKRVVVDPLWEGEGDGERAMDVRGAVGPR